jgi:hypothetical protein
MEAAQYAANRGVRVYTVAFGTPDGFIPGMEGCTFYTKVDEETLQAIAKVTGGEFFKASNADDLKMIYQKLSSRFSMEKRETEITALFVLGSVALVAMAVLLSLIWFRRTASPHHSHASLKMSTPASKSQHINPLKSAGNYRRDGSHAASRIFTRYGCCGI